LGRIQTGTACYIKLGPSGAWEDRCFTEGTIRLGHQNVLHDLALTGDREAIKRLMIGQGVNATKASDKAREVLSFYDGREDIMWITFAHGFMW